MTEYHDGMNGFQIAAMDEAQKRAHAEKRAEAEELVKEEWCEACKGVTRMCHDTGTSDSCDGFQEVVKAVMERGPEALEDF